MNDSLSRLIYISSNRIQGDDTTVRNAIDDILKFARDSNAVLGVTGALMFNKGCFAQVLEGERNSVEEVFERIQYDQRHSDVVIISFETIQTRCFASWSMGYVGEDQNISETFDRISNSSGFAASEIPFEQIFNLIREKLIEAESDAYHAILRRQA